MADAVPGAIADEISRRRGETIQSFSFIGGGCINHGGRLRTSRGDYFLKWNDRVRCPGMFNAECQGLEALAAAKALRIPGVVFAGEAGAHQFLLLEFIAEAPRRAHYWENFGAGLAALHKQTTARAGFDYDNFIGSLPQDNTPDESWVRFFISRRLEPQLQRAMAHGAFDCDVPELFERLYRRLPDIIPDEAVSLLHGDLWGGNLMTGNDGLPCLIDPAVYYGHREVDLAMTQLFGGFDARYLESYQEAFPLQPGYKERLSLYNLYPLLVHVNLFGGGYAAQVLSVLRRFA